MEGQNIKNIEKDRIIDGIPNVVGVMSFLVG